MDLVGDMLTRIRNGLLAKKTDLEVLYSKEVLGVLRVLKDEGYIENYSENELRKGVKRISVALKYWKNEPTIKEIKRISKPSRRVYTPIGDLTMFYNGLGIYVLSTSKGIMSDVEARANHVGGELMCSIF